MGKWELLTYEERGRNIVKRMVEEPAPAPALVAFAQEVLARFHAATLAHSLPWEEPRIGSNERGQITLEWWYDPRTLTVFIRSAEHVDYLKSWGSDILKDMEDGEITRPSDFVTLTRWLYQPTLTDEARP